MPKVNFSIPLIALFDYQHHSQITMTHDLAPLASTLRNQKYSLSLKLTTPSSWENHHQVGNFNVHLKIGQPGQPGFLQATQFSLLKYRSWMLNVVRTLIWMPFLVLGVVQEQDVIHIPLIEAVLIAPLQLFLTINTQKLTFYKAELHFDASIGIYKRMLSRFFWPVALVSVSGIFMVLLLAIGLRLLIVWMLAKGKRQVEMFEQLEEYEELEYPLQEEDSLFIDRLFEIDKRNY